MCKVSIVIPVYNTEIYLSKAIESCLNQSLTDIEVIIVNDGSTDNSLSIAQDYEKKHDNCYVISTENKGLSEARNTGLKVAKGKYVYFLDSDDWIKPETIEHCHSMAVKNNLDMVLFDSKVEVDVSLVTDDTIDYNYCIRNDVVDPNRIYTGRDFVELYSGRKGVFVQAWLVFTNREFLIDNHIYFLPGAYYEDVDFHFLSMMLVNRIMYIPQAFHRRLYREGSIMTSLLNERKICSVYRIANNMFSSIINRQKYNDDVWLQYLTRRIKGLFGTVLGNVDRESIAYVRPDSLKILDLQVKCIDKYYKVLKLSDSKVSNVRKALEFAEEVTTPLGWITNEMIDVIDEIRKEREWIVHNILSKLPLGKNGIKIGVYGSGNHAEYLLNLYKDMIGGINAEIVFIDTYKKSYSKKHNNCDLVNIDDLSNLDISEIIILSYFYEDEMYNNIVSRYGNQYNIHRIYDGDKEPIDSTTYLDIYNRLKNFHNNGRKRIVLINTPLHTNVGDHIIAHANMMFFKEHLPDYDIMEISNKMYKDRRKEVIYKTHVDDIIVITGGGFLGSLWPYSGKNVYGILKDFPDNKIVIFPQSLYFEENEEGERQKQLAYELFHNHIDLTACYREANSYNRSENIFGDKIKSYLLPDMALTLNYSKEQHTREGVLLCLRNDKESILSEDIKTSLKEYFVNKGEDVRETSMHWHSSIMPNQREEVINEKTNEFKACKLVITDTLHCMISCVISGTPCIALDNISSKVEGIYSTWLNDIGYIRYVNSYKEIFDMDLDGWDELHKNNYYDKHYKEYMIKIASIICN